VATRRPSSLKTVIYEQIARIGKAAASPSRLELLDLLSQGPRTVEALARQTGQSVATTSHHLQVLRRARLVEAQKRGLFVTYRLADQQVGGFFLHLRGLAESRLAEIAQARAAATQAECRARFDEQHLQPHESPAVVTVPLILLAIPSVGAGWVIGPVLFGGYFGDAIVAAPAHDVLAAMGKDFRGVVAMIVHALGTAPFWLAVGGIAAATYLYLLRPDLPAALKEKAGMLYTILERKYGFDEAYQWLFGDGAVRFGTGLWKGGDVTVIDGVFVDGSARVVGWCASVIRYLQSGFIYHYAFAMIIGILVLLTMIFL